MTALLRLRISELLPHSPSPLLVSALQHTFFLFRSRLVFVMSSSSSSSSSSKRKLVPLLPDSYPRCSQCSLRFDPALDERCYVHPGTQ